MVENSKSAMEKMLGEFRHGNNFVEIFDLENAGVENTNVFLTYVHAEIWRFSSFSTMAFMYTRNRKDAG
jgi:hypothetical protein